MGLPADDSGGPPGNADSNVHMIAINEQLGYEQVHPGWQAQTLDVAAFLSR
jgi:hypothetical protein